MDPSLEFGVVNVVVHASKRINLNFLLFSLIDRSKHTGFCDLIPMQLLRPFDERELELIIGGLQAIDVQDWKTNTRLKHCTPETPQVQWFWQVC